jgi:CRISPR/Cas system Type II protein with McrA/HNH and RuvC-like nuclease domain
MVNKSIRFKVFARDGFTCQYCGKTPPEAILEVDHIMPRSKGGFDCIENLVTACRDCNRGKSDKVLKSKVYEAQKAEMENFKESNAQLIAYQAYLMARRRKAQRDLLYVIKYLREETTYEENGHQYCISIDEKADGKSILYFLKRLPLAEVLEAVDIALSWLNGHYRGEHEFDRLFKYFCGVCHKKIKNANGGHHA